MRKFLLLSSLTLGLFLLVPPVYAVNYNFTGEAQLNWNTLRFSGIPITMTESGQGQGAFSPPDFQQNHVFQDWRPHSTTFFVPHGTWGSTSITDADSNRLYTYVNTFGTSEPPAFGVGQANEAHAERFGTFTAMDTGQLTVSIDYTLQQVGSLPSGFEALERGTITLFVHPGESGAPPPNEDQGLLSTSSGTPVQSGTLSITESYQRGDTGEFFAEAQVAAGYVPVPDMLWPTLAGMIGIAFWAERRRRQAGLTP